MSKRNAIGGLFEFFGASFVEVPRQRNSRRENKETRYGFQANSMGADRWGKRPEALPRGPETGREQQFYRACDL